MTTIYLNTYRVNAASSAYNNLLHTNAAVLPLTDTTTAPTPLSVQRTSGPPFSTATIGDAETFGFEAIAMQENWVITTPVVLTFTGALPAGEEVVSVSVYGCALQDDPNRVATITLNGVQKTRDTRNPGDAPPAVFSGMDLAGLTVPFDITVERIGAGGCSNSLIVIETLPTAPQLNAPTSIQGDGLGIAYSGSQLSTTAPLRVQFSNDGYATLTEREIPTTQTDANGGTFDWIAGAESAAGGSGGQGLGVPYTQDGWQARLIMQNEAGDGDVTPLDITHTIIAGANVQEFSAGTYNDNGNGRCNPDVAGIGDNDQLYHLSDQQAGGTPDPLTLDFADPDHPGPASVGGDTESYTGPSEYAWYRTDGLKWTYMRAAVVPAPLAQVFTEEFTEEFT